VKENPDSCAFMDHPPVEESTPLTAGGKSDHALSELDSERNNMSSSNSPERKEKLGLEMPHYDGANSDF